MMIDKTNVPMEEEAENVTKDEMKILELSQSYMEDDTSIYEYDYPCLRRKRNR